jgi:hypothetical protein
MLNAKVLVTWETEGYKQKSEIFQNVNEANLFVEQNCFFETMTHTTYTAVKEVVKQIV